MTEYFGLKIKKDGIAKDVENCTPNELAFDSNLACAKIVQPGKYSFTIADSTTTEYTVALNSILSLPILVLVFLYDSGDSSYKGLGSEAILDPTQDYRGKFEFTSSNLYVTVENYTGSNISSHFIYFICYA